MWKCPLTPIYSPISPERGKKFGVYRIHHSILNLVEWGLVIQKLKKDEWVGTLTKSWKEGWEENQQRDHWVLMGARHRLETLRSKGSPVRSEAAKQFWPLRPKKLRSREQRRRQSMQAVKAEDWQGQVRIVYGRAGRGQIMTHVTKNVECNPFVALCSNNKNINLKRGQLLWNTEDNHCYEEKGDTLTVCRGCRCRWVE